MTDFKQAIQWLKEGKKVRRSGIKNKKWYLFASEKIGEIGFVHLHHTTFLEPKIHHFDISTFEATDWEIYEENSKLKEVKEILIELQKEKKAMKELKKWLEEVCN